MPRLRLTQEFKTYVNANPALIPDLIQDDLTARPGWYIKQMGVLQYSTNIVVWALWESEVIA